MKKLIACILATVLLICSLTLCGTSYEENAWFSDEKLEECLVVGLPEITSMSFVKRYDDDIYASMPGAELKAYVESIYEFLKAQDFEYICGCRFPDTEKEHVNYDEDNFCDICEYDFT